jgi:predicted ATPase
MNQKKQEQLSRIVIKGFKSIRECELELNHINVLIGSNGAGKSNFISALELLQKIAERGLSGYAQKKGANSLFHNGTNVTDSISAEFYFGNNVYSFELEMTENNSLSIIGESIGLENSPWSDGGYGESKLQEWRGNPNIDRDTIDTVLSGQWRIYHFHDTGPTAKIKFEHNISNCDVLQKDASNLAAFLYRLREYYSTEYGNILKVVQMIAPYFEDFILKPEEGNREHIILRWQQKDCEDIFNASQLSDGTLRFICLAALLLQPTELQPATIIIDEPELGLHPFANAIFAEMVQKAAVNKQVVLATQSIELLDNFEPEDVIVVVRNKNGSEFKRLSSEQLSYWLENDYTLGELWNKNIFGGRLSQ